MFERPAQAFGAKTHLIVLHEDETVARQALAAAASELERVDAVLSLYQPESELCRLNRQGVLNHPHPYLLEVLRKSQRMSEETGGAFDVTVQPLWELYAATKKAGRLPGNDEIEAARRKVDWRQVKVTPDSVHLETPGMAVTLNALVQGFALDQVLRVLRAHRIERALVNTGEIGALGRKAGGQPWTIGIQHPRRAEAYVEMVELVDRCMATSGDYATHFDQDYLRHHIFSPNTGRSPEELASVTVVAASGSDADALSTAMFVLGSRAGIKLIESFPGAEAFLVLQTGRTMMTPHFPKA